ncbi:MULTISPECIES: hypothetical protein [Pseudomonas]|jgi:hypothetical protein|uniref:Uncharacterized protein n=1 Tax=Pseudomonas umsongensis TaxID=198618 RepID=A0AAE6ZSB8_9PSED|nr:MULTISPECIES: hypothetical protein [Pseudomonas]EPA97997.1 hypothetical protein PG5_17260 [Pseudomonas sp. G5(2012)]QJC76726.1 hypothetical protein HGP31_04695 [Pseudomonas umsongensis]
MLAMVLNDDAGSLTPSGVFEFIASMLAPTGEKSPKIKKAAANAAAKEDVGSRSYKSTSMYTG